MKWDLLKALGWTGTASVAKFAKLLYWKTVTNSAEKEKSYSWTKVNLARENTTKDIMWKGSGSLEESRKTAGNVSWWQ